MKLHTNEYKQKINLMGKEIDSKISFGDTVLGKDDLNAVTSSVQSALLKSAMKQLEIDSNVEIPLETVLTYQFGVKVNGEYEYLNFGNYVVYKAEKQEDTGSFKLTCYDKMLYSMKDYVDIGIQYPITIRDYTKKICEFLGLNFKNANEEFANYDKIIPNELYLNANNDSIGYTFRDVFDELAQVTASMICINENDEVEIRYINDTGDIIDEEYLKDVNVNFGEKYGPINSIVLSRSGESDNVYLKDNDSVEANGLIELKIIDNQIMNFNNRDEFLPDILEKLNGLEYYLNDYSSTGVTYYDICDRYNVKIGDNTYSCVMFNDEILVTQGLEENIFTEMPKETQTDYTKADTTDRKINQVYIIVNKQNGTINSLVSSVESVNTTINNNYQEIIEKFNGYVPQNDFVTLENSVQQIQTDTYTKTEINTKLTDGSVTKVMTTSGVFDENGMHYEKTDAPTKTTINEKGVEVSSTTGLGEELLYAGYDENLNDTIVRTSNLTVRKYFVIGANSRFENYEDGTGVFDI